MPVSKSRLAARSLAVAGILGAAFACNGCGVEKAAAAQATPSGLAAVLAQMNAASAKFSSAQADLKQELFTKIVHDTETQTGQIYVQRKGGAAEMGIRLLPPDAKPGAVPAQIVLFKHNVAQRFSPGTNQIDELSATGKNQATAESVMSLGFGSSGSDLAKVWTITDQGSEKMSDGSKTVPVEKLDLVSKDPGIRNNYATHITIWVDPARGVSLKQVSYNASDGTATGDTRTVYYTNIRLNQPVDAALFAIKCNGKCTVVSH